MGVRAGRGREGEGLPGTTAHTHLETASPQQLIRALQWQHKRAIIYQRKLFIFLSKPKHVKEEVFNVFRFALLISPLLAQLSPQLREAHLLINAL